MKPITVEEMKKIDSFAINELGMPMISLMENAGCSVARLAQREYGKISKAVILCGKGFNGGDGLVATRHLYNNGTHVIVYLLGGINELKPETKTNYEIIRKIGIQVEFDIKNLVNDICSADAVVDALFGIGFSGETEGVFSDAINIVNENKYKTSSKIPYKVVSVDIPSGVNATTGEVAKNTAAADLTITFHLPKIGLYKYPASSYCGLIQIADIGIPYENLNPKILNPKIIKEQTNVTDIQFVERAIPSRKFDVHKVDCGKVLVIAGSSGMSGAAVLTSRAAMRSGAGLVVLGCPKSIKNSINCTTPEIIVLGLSETEEQTLSHKSYSEIKNQIEKFDAVVIGPGISTHKDTKKLVNMLIKDINIKIPIILDADGLNCVSPNITVLLERKHPTIITPHPGELSRLLKIDVASIQKNRIESAKTISNKLQCITILKGANSVIASPDGKIFINPTGNPGMATAGTGDVLTGIISGLIAQGAKPYDAAVSGSFIHGMAGDIIVQIKGQHGLIASDIIESIPFVIESIVKKSK